MASIVAGVATAAGLLNQWRKSNANTARQIQNDGNAQEWQTGLIEANKDMRLKLDAAWEARVMQAQSIASLEEKVRYLDERIKDLAQENVVLRQQLKGIP